MNLVRLKKVMSHEIEQHHVAWNDRLNLNKIWEQCMLRCIDSYGTDEFSHNVHLFHMTIININDGPPLNEIIERYIDNDLKSWKTKQYNDWYHNPRNRQDRSMQEHQERTLAEIDYKAHEKLFYFIIQTLENNNFGFYKSNLVLDKVGLDD